MIDSAELMKLAISFATVLGLLAALGFVLKYLNMRGFTLPNKAIKPRRMQMVETLSIDARRRAVILRCDGREHLLLLGAERDIVVETNLPPAPLPPVPGAS